MAKVTTTFIPRRLRHLRLGLVAFGLVSAAAMPQSGFAAGSGKSETRDSPYVGQTQVAATVMRSLRPVGVFQADIGIVVADAAQRARALSMQPVLRDAWRRTTQDFANNYLIVGRVPDAVLLGQKLQSATDQILGANAARVMLTSVIVR